MMMNIQENTLTYSQEDDKAEIQREIADSDSTSTNGEEMKLLEEDPEFVEYQERAEIVAKYDKGTDGQAVDEWENPNFSLYHITDRYGFIHENGIGSPDREEELAKRKEIKREGKWRKMLNNWEKFYRTIKLRDRVRKGVPDKFRAELWKKVLGVEEIKIQNEGVYDQLKLRARLLAKDIKQIDMDINRTYRDHLFFRRRYDLKQQSMLHVLGAYSMFNTEVGYCQGMSQVAALMLMYMNEEDAFWALHVLMCDRRHAMHGFFVQGFPKLHRYEEHYKRILDKYLHRLKKHMDKLQVPLIYTTRWWFGCFLDMVPFTLALRLWDMFISEGEPVMIAMSYNIVKMHQKLLRRANFEETLDILQHQLGEEFGYTDSVVIDSLIDCMRKLRADGTHMPPDPVLPPPPGMSSEVPTKPFGMVLHRPMDEIHRSISAIQSRKTSRAPSMSYSTPGTPGHLRSKNQLRVDGGSEGMKRPPFNSIGDPQGIDTVVENGPSGGLLDANNVHLSPRGSQSADPVTLSPVDHQESEKMENGPTEKPLPTAGSFYDNVPGFEMDDGANLNDSFHSEESEYKNEKFVRPDGTVVYQTECTITRMEVQSKTISLTSSPGGKVTSTPSPVFDELFERQSSQQKSPCIRIGPNHVTYVEVVPEGSVGSQDSPLRKFPVSPSEIRTRSSRQTQV